MAGTMTIQSLMKTVLDRMPEGKMGRLNIKTSEGLVLKVTVDVIDGDNPVTTKLKVTANFGKNKISFTRHDIDRDTYQQELKIDDNQPDLIPDDTKA